MVKEQMVELKILEETELDGEELEEGDVVNVPRRQGAKLVFEGIARPASFSDFAEETEK